MASDTYIKAGDKAAVLAAFVSFCQREGYPPTYNELRSEAGRIGMRLHNKRQLKSSLELLVRDGKLVKHPRGVRPRLYRLPGTLVEGVKYE